MQTIHEFEQVKVLGHSQRLAILRRLMAGAATLSQLGEYFEETPAHIRHHLKVLEQAGLVELVKTRPVRGGLEKYYQATSRAFLINLAVLPEPPARHAPLVLGSNDYALEQLTIRLRQKELAFMPLILPLDSLNGLMALRQGVCQMSTCHLIELDSQGYNRSFVRHFFPGQRMALIRIFLREEGLLVAPGNPQQIHSLEDLARPNVRMVNREHGSGIRQWLDQALKRVGVPSENISGYTDEVDSHDAVARAVMEKKADTGLGIVASARQFGLEFIPLFEEPYELVVPQQQIADERLQPFFEHINSGEFRLAVNQLDGYHIPQTAGSIEWID